MATTARSGADLSSPDLSIVLDLYAAHSLGQGGHCQAAQDSDSKLYSHSDDDTEAGDEAGRLL